MIFLTENNIRINAKKFGFKKFDITVLESLNKYLANYTKNMVKKALKKYKKENKQIKQIKQSGGRIVLPSEYFGIDSGSYFENSYGTDMTSTHAMIRPAQYTSDLTGAITGGSASATKSNKSKNSNKFIISTSVFKNALSEAKISLEKEIVMDTKTIIDIKQRFENMISEIFIKLEKKTSDHYLKLNNLEEIITQTKYKILKN